MSLEAVMKATRIEQKSVQRIVGALERRLASYQLSGSPYGVNEFYTRKVRALCKEIKRYNIKLSDIEQCLEERF
jgi:hypothetical protein